MLLEIFFVVAISVIILALVALVFFERIRWHYILIELISRALPLTDEHIKFQVARFLARAEEEKAKAKRKRTETKQQRKKAGKEADTIPDSEEESPEGQRRKVY
jgi:hypothetical protein